MHGRKHGTAKTMEQQKRNSKQGTAAVEKSTKQQLFFQHNYFSAFHLGQILLSDSLKLQSARKGLWVSEALKVEHCHRKII